MPPRSPARRRPEHAERGSRYTPVPLSPRHRSSISTASPSSYPFSPSRKPVPPLPPPTPSTHVRTPSTLDHSVLPSTPAYSITRGVASGLIGSDYGPYAYNPHEQQSMHNTNRFSSQSSSSSGSTPTSASSSTTNVGYYDRPVPPLPPPTPHQDLLPDLTIHEKSPMLLGRRLTTSEDSRLPQYIYSKHPELDDAIHNPNYREPWYSEFTVFSSRGWMNAIALLAITGGLLTLFVGLPIMEYVQRHHARMRGYNIGGINATGQIPKFAHFPSLIDPDTPEDVLTRIGSDGQKYDLAFSDEFSTEGRTFYPGDDPFWEAADLHYWATGDLEYYDPQAITTQDGKLVITMSERSINGLDYMSGMLTSWNKLCFTTGYVEVSISLPGTPDGEGLWPGAWTLGNLGRAGYGATTEGMWPYSYDSCDSGTFPNQTSKAGEPADVATGGNGGGPLSFLPGQRASACTCPGSDHPGPSPSKGRSAPEIDILEAQIDLSREQGQASQSFQVAPFDLNYYFANTTPATTVYDSSKTQLNTYRGGVYQQALSAVTYIDREAYGGREYSTYGYEWFSNPNARDEGYITWYYNGGRTWTVTSASSGPNPSSGVGQRLIPEEPMYLILNLGMAPSFQPIDFDKLRFPATMYVDYVRVYQRTDVWDGLTCDPASHPTKDYIDRHMNAYTNRNLTTWEQAGYEFPRNELYEGSC